MSTKDKTNAPMDYRSDIDGLRAVAVLSVIVFHINEEVIPGGFVGVDIFFVISGYLITQHIVRDLNRGAFSIIEFYRRRVKRIIPAMLAVVAVSVVVSQFIFLPGDAEKVAESGLWSLLSMANVYFWLFEDTSYFAAASNEKPLLHLWSLGVEEQFYIFWPLMLLLAYKVGRDKYLFLLFSLFSIVSFIAGELLFSQAPSFVYYMLPTRAGELLVGALLAQFLLKRGTIKIPGYVLTVTSFAGLFLIVGSLLLLSEQDVFPGVRAMFPTLGAATLIFTGHYGRPVINQLLTFRPIVWVGVVSYSAYLWHWPVLAFYRYGYSDITFFSGVIIFALTMLVSWLSYRYVETPFRYSKDSAVRVFIRQFFLPSGFIVFISLSAMKLDGYGVRWFSDGYKATIADLRNENRPAYQYDYVCQRQVITEQVVNNPDCVVGADSGAEPRAILWGDSNAAHYIGALGAFAEREGFRFRNVQIGSCPPIDVGSGEFVSGRRALDCDRSREVALSTVDKYKVIIVSANWTDYSRRSESFLSVFYEMIEGFVAEGKKVILLGKAPVIHSFDRLCREKAVSYPLLSCEAPIVPLDPDVEKVNGLLRAFAERVDNVEYYDFNHYLCKDGYCGARDSNGKLVYFDSSHLSLDASWRLGRRVVKNEGVPFPFNAIQEWIH